MMVKKRAKQLKGNSGYRNFETTRCKFRIEADGFDGVKNEGGSEDRGDHWEEQKKDGMVIWGEVKK